MRIANGSNNAGAKILFAADKIQNSLGSGIVKHAVDGEITPLGIFLRRGKLDMFRSAPKRILAQALFEPLAIRTHA